MNYTEILFIWLAVISAVSVIVTVYDKLAAKSGARRVAEKTLLGLGLIGGACAIFMTMLLIRHKTRHTKFMVGLPLEIVLHIVIISAVALI